MSDGPICHIPPVTTHDQPHPTALPSVPMAQPNIDSLVDTVNRLRQLVMILSGQQRAQGRPGLAKTSSGSDGFKVKNPGDEKSTWVEQSRATERVRVFQNNDKTSDNWVDVDRLNSLVMRDKNTNQTWRWDRERS